MTARRALLVGLLVVLAGCAQVTGPETSPSPSATPATTAPEPTIPTTAAPEPTTTAPTTTTQTTSPTSTPVPSATFVVDGERRTTVTLEVADTPGERRRGLMNRTSLPRDHGMVFVYADAAPRTFWMKNTLVPLDIIFVAANGTVRNVAHAAVQPNASDEELRRYHSDGPAKYVIEVNRGFANRTGVTAGARVIFHGPRSLLTPTAE